jgi:serine/threonine-protein kinase
MADARGSLELPYPLSHYLLEQYLGGGGMGEVYLARDRRTDERVVVKLLHTHLESDPTFRERFEREAHVAALLRSPYTVHLIEYGQASGRLFLAMDYVEGRTLREVLGAGSIETTRALRICAQVARALEEAQARNVVHRDIKPENIMLEANDVVRVLDFGVARLSGSAGITMPGIFVGTAAYAAPETVSGRPDTRSDIYSLGATLFHCLAGRPPFEGDMLDVLRQHRESPVPVERLRHVPPQVVATIERCMAKDPAARFQTASELAGRLEELASLISVERTIVSSDAATQVAPTGQAVSGLAAAPSGFMAGTGATPSVIMELVPRASSRFGGTSYDLVVRNTGGVQADVQVSGQDPENSVEFVLPPPVSVPPGGSVVVPVQVKPRKRRLTGEGRNLTFTLTGAGAGMPPVNVSSAVREPSWGRLPFLGLAAVAALAAAGALAFALAGGGDDTPAGPGDGTPVVTATTPASSPTAGAATVTGTPSPTVTRTVTPTPGSGGGVSTPPTPTPIPPTPTPVPPTPTPVPPTPTPIPPTPTPTPPPPPVFTNVRFCSNTGVCVANGGTIGSAGGGCYPSRLWSYVDMANLRPPTNVAVRWTYTGYGAFREDSYSESNVNTTAQAYVDANPGTGFDPGTYVVEWGIVGQPPYISGTFYLTCN